jgi:DNA-binding CsgD family transcriptional regulator
MYKAMTSWGYAEFPAVMILVDPCALHKDISRHDIQTHFDLTVTEAEIARLVCLGQSSQDIARQRKVSPNTINQQIKAVLAKTHSRNQVELVSLVLRTLLTP